ncbi:MAG TPA: alpha/beta fold hydrolase [Jatrophihabitans sp.]|nr:alpha/beta fold hydrolase [Jatrophihabitans sp.]
MTIGQSARTLGRRLSRVLWSTRRRLVATVTVLVLLLAGLGALAVAGRSPAVRTVSQFVAGTPEQGGAPVRLDSTLYLPASTPAPAVLLAHGFGGSKQSVAGEARALAGAGYVVLAYSARGFGASGGLIHLDSVHYEVADGSRLLDWLAARPEVLRRSGRPVLGVAGSSYGGALALMLGATDHRIGAVAADITWNNLATALFPNEATGAGAAPLGVFKKLWTGYLFSAGFPTGASAGDPAAGDPAAAGSCGRFAPELCRLYQAVASGGQPPPGVLQLLADSSPATVLSQLRAPVLLTQGQQDSLFPLSEADANARQLSAAGAPVSVRWRSGGHDAPGAAADVTGWQRQFFDAELRDRGSVPGGFLMSQIGAGISASDGRTVDTTLRAPDYPGVNGVGGFDTATLPLTSGPAQQVVAPAGGTPAAVSSIPGLGGVLGTAAGLSGVLGGTGLSAVPGQVARFATAPLAEPRLVVGASGVRLAVTAGRTGSVTLFASLHDVAPDGTDTLPARLVSPVRLAGAPGAVHTVSVQLPWIVQQIPAGHRLVVEVSSTDFQYALPAQADSYRIGLAAGTLTVSTLPTSQVRSGDVLVWVLLAALVLLLCAGYAGWRLRARRPPPPDPALATVPVVVRDLQKVYADGFRAVDGVSFRVERGQVLGLLGPNGAGKTTTLRVLMGLILPTAGAVRVFGEQVVPGAPVLSRLGAFVEGPGFLPHLTGLENLRLFWAASGRPVAAAGFDTVLEIAGLGASVHRRVKTYSHGMQQRLAIAQAMLGLPEVLILDEPTNGLDPPQIAEMREVLAGYAATGRTVIVSSHLLAEVEQTCTHVVVMHRGRLVAAGSVAEVAGAGAMHLSVPEPERAVAVLAAAGIPASAVPARRALEDVFLDLIGERGD